MAGTGDVSLDDCDGVFTHHEMSLDEVDSAKTVHFIDFSHIPATYCMTSDKKPVKHSRLKMVHKSWGKQISHLVEECCGHLALLTADRACLDEKKIKAFSHNVQADKTFTDSVHLLRYGAKHILAHFRDVDVHDALATALFSNKIDCEGAKFVRLEPVIQRNPPKCFIEVCTSRGEELHTLLTDTVLSFSSAFAFATIFNQSDSNISPTADQSQVTSHAITMMFDGANQAHACRAKQVLSQPPWQPVLLSDSVCRALDSDVQLYSNSMDRVPVWGIRDGCVQSGVQLTVFVRNLEMYSQMQQFYSKIIGVQPFHREFPSSDTCYSVFALSSRAELVVAYYPGLGPQHCEHLSLCVQVKTEPAEGVNSIAPGYWQTHDPEGNSVILFMVLC